MNCPLESPKGHEELSTRDSVAVYVRVVDSESIWLKCPTPLANFNVHHAWRTQIKLQLDDRRVGSHLCLPQREADITEGHTSKGGE